MYIACYDQPGGKFSFLGQAVRISVFDFLILASIGTCYLLLLKYLLLPVVLLSSNSTYIIPT